MEKQTYTLSRVGRIIRKEKCLNIPYNVTVTALKHPGEYLDDLFRKFDAALAQKVGEYANLYLIKE